MYEPKPLFIPPNASAEVKFLAQYIADELRQVSAAAHTPVDVVRLNVLHVAPAKPQATDLARADGTDWDPGAGRGVYEYDGAAWNKL